MSLGHLGFEGIALLVLFSITLGVIIHPLQFAMVQFLEGYWGTARIARRVRTQRILRYQAKVANLDEEQLYSTEYLNYLSKLGVTEPANLAPYISRRDEALRIMGNFPPVLDDVMPTRLGNVLRRAESHAGSQYGMDALQVVPHLLMVAPAGHVDYVNDQRLQLDLAVRMTFVSVAATVTAVLFLWPYHYWVLIAIIPYALAYLSYKGSLVAAGHYASAFDTLINLDRFTLYQQLHLEHPATTDKEREMNAKMKKLFDYSEDEDIHYEQPTAGDENQPSPP
jgi:hypothetical protein